MPKSPLCARSQPVGFARFYIFVTSCDIWHAVCIYIWHDGNMGLPRDWRKTMKTTNVKTGWGYTSQAYADSTGTVRVYDRVAGYYTTCHSLTAGQIARVRRLAAN